MIHRVVVYLRPDNTIAHIQSTNGETWPGLVVETDLNDVVLPLRRIELELEATLGEIAKGENGRPQHRRASVLFQDELEVVSGKVRYRSSSGQVGAITERP